MVQACCKYSGQKYMENESTFDMDKISKLYPSENNTKISYELEDLEVLFKRTIPEKDRFVKRYSVSYDGKTENLCSCECHIKGLIIFH